MEVREYVRNWVRALPQRCGGACGLGPQRDESADDLDATANAEGCVNLGFSDGTGEDVGTSTSVNSVKVVLKAPIAVSEDTSEDAIVAASENRSDSACGVSCEIAVEAALEDSPMIGRAGRRYRRSKFKFFRKWRRNSSSGEVNLKDCASRTIEDGTSSDATPRYRTSSNASTCSGKGEKITKMFSGILNWGRSSSVGGSRHSSPRRVRFAEQLIYERSRGNSTPKKPKKVTIPVKMPRFFGKSQSIMSLSDYQMGFEPSYFASFWPNGTPYRIKLVLDVLNDDRCKTLNEHVVRYPLRRCPRSFNKRYFGWCRRTVCCKKRCIRKSRSEETLDLFYLGKFTSLGTTPRASVDTSLKNILQFEMDVTDMLRRCCICLHCIFLSMMCVCDNCKGSHIVHIKDLAFLDRLTWVLMEDIPYPPKNKEENQSADPPSDGAAPVQQDSTETVTIHQEPKVVGPENEEPAEEEQKKEETKVGDPEEGDSTQEEQKEEKSKVGDTIQEVPNVGDPNEGFSTQVEPKVGDPEEEDPMQEVPNVEDPKEEVPTQVKQKKEGPKVRDLEEGDSLQEVPNVGDPKEGDSMLLKQKEPETNVGDSMQEVPNVEDPTPIEPKVGDPEEGDTVQEVPNIVHSDDEDSDELDLK